MGLGVRRFAVSLRPRTRSLTRGRLGGRQRADPAGKAPAPGGRGALGSLRPLTADQGCDPWGYAERIQSREEPETCPPSCSCWRPTLERR